MGFTWGLPAFSLPIFPAIFGHLRNFVLPSCRCTEAPCREEDQSKILQKHQQKAGELLPRGCQQNPAEQTRGRDDPSWGRDTVMAPGMEAVHLFSLPGSALAVPIAVPVSRLPPAGWVPKGPPHTSPRCFSLSLSPPRPCPAVSSTYKLVAVHSTRCLLRGLQRVAGGSEAAPLLAAQAAASAEKGNGPSVTSSTASTCLQVVEASSSPSDPRAACCKPQLCATLWVPETLEGAMWGKLCRVIFFPFHKWKGEAGFQLLLCCCPPR